MLLEILCRNTKADDVAEEAASHLSVIQRVICSQTHTSLPVDT